MGNNYNRIRISSNCVKLMGNNYVVLLYLKLSVHISCQYTKLRFLCARDAVINWL